MKLLPLVYGSALIAWTARDAHAMSGREPLASALSVSNQADDREEAALARVNEALKLDPQNASAYLIRGNIYGEKELWDLAEEDYQQALKVDPENLVAKVNLAELEFRQKRYDLARPDYVALENNPEISDLAGYKVFLCDLFGAHESLAQQELQTFNTVGENASYYFGNIAWALFHHESATARNFLASAEGIYGPKKIELYAASLLELGYLPLPDAP